MIIGGQRDKFKFRVTVDYELSAPTVSEAKDMIQATFAMMGLSVDGIEYIHDVRSDRQNRALHLWFRLLAEALNEAGYDIKKFIRDGIDVPWSKDTIKEYIWRPVQTELLGSKSTKQLKTDEIDKVFNVINKHVGERTHVHVPFPSVDSICGKLPLDV